MRNGSDENVVWVYDTQRQTAVVGAAAYEQALEAGVYPDELVSISEMLLQPAPTRTETRLPVDDWSREDYIAYGKWLLDAASPKLTHKILQTSYDLGLGPEPQRLYRKDRSIDQPRFKGYAGFYREIGALESVKRGEYSDWDLKTTLKYVERQAVKVADDGIRPTVDVFENLAKNGRGPNNDRIKRLTGLPYGKLLDLVGYPEPRAWTLDDYIDWGVRFTIANDRIPYHGGIVKLARTFRGPSEMAIHRRFGGIMSFQTLVMERYEQLQKEQAEKATQIHERLKLDVESHKLPAELLELPDEDAVKIAARCWLVQHILRDTAHDALPKSVRESNSGFKNYIQKYNPSVTDADIETTASTLGVFDYLWPPQEKFKSYLKVT